MAVWDSVGYILLNLGRYDEAISALRTALGLIEELRPGYYQTTMLTLIRTGPHVTQTAIPAGYERQAAPTVEHGAPPVPTCVPAVEETIRAWHDAGRTQRAIARELGIDRRKIKLIINHPT